MIKAGDRVQIKPEWQDAGDADYVWITCEDEDKGRVTILGVRESEPSVFDYAMQIVRVDMLVPQ